MLTLARTTIAIASLLALMLIGTIIGVRAQTVTVGAPTIACDTPNGVGCNGKTVLPAGLRDQARPQPPRSIFCTAVAV
jgi:hypothetical protein